jgi:hypothetical protein
LLLVKWVLYWWQAWRFVESLQKKNKNTKRKLLSQRHFVHHKPHKHWLGIETQFCVDRLATECLRQDKILQLTVPVNYT